MKYNLSFIGLVLCSIMLSGLLIQPIQVSHALTVYQTFTDSASDTYYYLMSTGWTSVYQMSATNQYNQPYHTPWAGLCVASNVVENYQYGSGWARKTFDSTNSTNFTLMNVTVWLYIQTRLSDIPNFYVNFNNRLLFGDCYISNGTMHQTDQWTTTWAYENTIWTDAQEPYGYEIAQLGWSTIHYTGGFNKLCLELYQTNISYGLRYYHNNVMVLDQLIWGIGNFVDPLEVYEVTIGLGRGTYIDDVSMIYAYQTTPINTVIQPTWYIGQDFSPLESPLIRNKPYNNNIMTLYAGEGTQTQISIWIDGVNSLNTTTDLSGHYTQPITFTILGTHTMNIYVLTSGIVRKSLTVTFTVSETGTPSGVQGFGGINWSYSFSGLISILPAGLIVGMLGGVISTAGAKFGHAIAGFLLGGTMGVILCTQVGFLPMWFTVILFMVGMVSLYFWFHNGSSD
jgi:hypothetical protein